MKFNFEGRKVVVNDGHLECDQDLKTILQPLLTEAYGCPEQGDPFLNLITQTFGRDSISDIEIDDNLIY